MRSILACISVVFAISLADPASAQTNDRYCHQYASIVSDIAADAIAKNPGCLDFSRGVHAVYDMHYSWCRDNSRQTVDGAADNIRRLTSQCAGAQNGGGRRQWVFCAQENEFCAAPNGSNIRYGANGVFQEIKRVDGGVACSNSVFGDPVPNVVKSCFYRTR